MIKIANTHHPVIDLIKHRWSARSFSNQVVHEDDLRTLIEAATWAPSANNEQPWQFVVATQDTERFAAIYDSLAAGNQPWCKYAPAFVVALARKTFKANGNMNPWAKHDVGIATGFLTLQATAMGLHTHPMAGYDKEKLMNNLNLPDNVEPLCVLAVGYLAAADLLEEPFKTRELTPRTRLPLSEVLL